MGQWKGPTLAWSPWFDWGKQKVLRELGFNLTGDIVTLDGHSFSYKANRTGIESVVHTKLAGGDSDFLFDYVRRFARELRVFGDLIPRLSLHDESSLVRLLEDFFGQYREIVWYSVFFVGDAVERQVRELAKAEGRDADSLLRSIHPVRLPYSLQKDEAVTRLREKCAAENILSLVKKRNAIEIRSEHPEIYEEMLRLVKEYEWVGTHHFWGTPYSVERLLEDLRSDASGKQESSKPLPKATGEIGRLIQAAQELAWLRYQSADVADLVSYALRPVLTRATERIALAYEDIIWLTHQEIIDYLNQGISADREEVREREKAHGAFLDGDEIRVITGNSLQKELATWVPQERDDIKEFHGTVAQKGRAKGKVRIVRTPAEIDSFQTGEILIASETTPNFVPAMRRAAAFVTDVGGITSHAAIIAREMQKPCIVGTKVATQVLKDGDLVEVDAEKGIVRVLKRGA